nr:Putative protease ydgD [Salmonella sp. NCTC 7297]
MHKTIAVLLGIVCFLPVIADARESDTDATDASDVKTLFFNHDDRAPVADPTQSPWDAIGQLETASGNLCTATLISPHIALTAGHCLLTPPKGKPDKAVALRFVAQKGVWRYEIHGIEGRVEPSLGRRLKADGDGWIVPPAAASWDFGLVILRYPPSGITPVPLFTGDKAALTAALKAADRKVTPVRLSGGSSECALFPSGLRRDRLGAECRALPPVRHVTWRQRLAAVIAHG